MKQALAALVTCVMCLVLLLYILSATDQRQSIERLEEPIVRIVSTFLPDGWTGVPLSAGNDLYKDLTDKVANRYLKKLVHIIREAPEDSLENFHEWIPKFDKLVPIIGINGIIDACSMLLKYIVYIRN